MYILYITLDIEPRNLLCQTFLMLSLQFYIRRLRIVDLNRQPPTMRGRTAHTHRQPTVYYAPSRAVTIADAVSLLQIRPLTLLLARLGERSRSLSVMPLIWY